jgi:osmoprotectant transport system ATP-binding protein
LPTSLPFLAFEDVSYRVNQRFILKSVSFALEQGETLVLLGRSGSGKTTALRLVNRLLDPAAGRIFLEGSDIAALDPILLRRRIGYVIQDVGLLPHWTIAKNVGLVPRLEGWPPAQVEERVSELLKQVGLAPEEYGSRYPHQLSGGQRQRAGVARALANRSKLMLFDEPFGALDPITRHELQQQFLDLRERLGIASLFVTHDVAEAMQLGTRIGLIEEGELHELMTPDEFRKSERPVVRQFLNTLPPSSEPQSSRTAS